jgi:hypothetical protein
MVSRLSRFDRLRLIRTRSARRRVIAAFPGSLVLVLVLALDDFEPFRVAVGALALDRRSGAADDAGAG